MKRLALFLFLIIFGLGLFLVWWENGKKPANSFDTSKKTFVVNSGEGVRTIASQLKKNDLIKDPTIFFLYVKKQGSDTNLQAGAYKLSPSMNLKEIVETLKHGTLDISVTFPEGIRAEEVGDILSKSIGSLSDADRQKLVANEGYLFPDTYLIPKNANVDLVISLMRDNFNKKTASLGVSPDSSQMRDAVIIASLIEREAQHAQDRPLVSSVIHNRLAQGMPLEIDATVQYAIGKKIGSQKWWTPVTGNDLSISSSYNTYKNAGLPPSPISNPGLSAIQAALHPADTDYLFYVSDKQGNLHFAKTLAQQNINIAKYLDN
jgi:UPF0755 protein